MRKVIMRKLTALLLPLAVLGVLLVCSKPFRMWANDGNVDAVSSASVILSAPDDPYIVLINRALHEKSGTLAVWEDFFAGKEIGVVYEDIDCIVLWGDPAGMEAARSFQSRLPENQMRIRQEDGLLAVSKAEHGKYDVIIMSMEAARAYGVKESGSIS